MHWKVGRWIRSCRLISEQSLIESTIWEFFMSSALWVSGVLLLVLLFKKVDIAKLGESN